MHNIVKGFFSSSKPNTNENQSHTEEELAVSHLKRVFEDFKNGRHQLEPVLPSFCKAFKSARAPEINEKFPEITDFTKCVAAEMVLKITRTASSRSLQDGSLALFQLLKNSQWNALCTINIAALSLSAVKQMCGEHLPSTLVKMLYLFMDLPDLSKDSQNVEMISKMLMSVLIRIGEHVCVVEELRATDSDLIVLFDICTSWWGAHNAPWQRCAIEFLSTICRKSLNQGLIEYLHINKCIAICVKNLRSLAEHYVIYISDTILPLFGCLKDSCEISDRLLDDFKEAKGYQLLANAILNLEKHAVESEEMKRMKNECINKLAYSVPTLCTAGFEQVIPEIHAKSMHFQSKDFCIPVPQGKGASVKNPAAFVVLQDVFLKCTVEQTSLLMLDVINVVFKLDEVNYFILSQHNTLNCFIAECLISATPLVQERILKLVEHVVFVLRYIPSSELEALIIFLKDSPDFDLASLILATINKLITADPSLKKVILELGLLNSLQYCQIQLLQLAQGEDKIDENYLNMLMTTLNTLLDNCPEAYQNYLELQGRDFLYDMLHVTTFRAYVLLVIKTLSTYVAQTDEQDDVRSLLRMMQENPENTELKLDILDCLSELFLSFPPSQHRFQAPDGFLVVASLIVSVGQGSDKNYMIVVGKVIKLLQSALHNSPSNIHYFENQVEYSSLTKSLEHLPCFQSVPPCEESIITLFKFLMGLALDLEPELCGPMSRDLANDTVLVSKHTELVDKMEYYDRSIVYPRVLTSILVLTRLSKSDEILRTVCEWVLQTTLLPHNLQLLSDTKFLTSLLTLFSHVFTDPNHAAHVRVVSVFEVLARHRLYPDQLRLFLRLDNPLYCERPESTAPRLNLDLNFQAHQGQGSSLEVVDIENGELLVTPTTNPATNTEENTTSESDTLEATKSDSNSRSESPEKDMLTQETALDVTNAEVKPPLTETETPVNTEDLRLALLETNGTTLEEDMEQDGDERRVPPHPPPPAPVQRELSRVKFLETADAISINSENPDDMPIYGNDEGSADMPIYGQGEVQTTHEEVMYDESGGAGGAPVIISVEEIERLKTEMAISFSGSNDKIEETYDQGGSDDESSEKWEVREEFKVKTLPKHHIELLVSVSTPVHGNLENVPYINIPKNSPAPGLILPYLIKPGSSGSDKVLQSSFTLVMWYQIPHVQTNSSYWQVTLLHHSNVKLTLLPSKLNVATQQSMLSQDAPLVKDDGSWHMITATFYKGTKIRSSCVDISIDIDWKTNLRIDYPALGEGGALTFGMSPKSGSCQISWNLGTFLLFDGNLGVGDLSNFYTAGPSYVGNLREGGSPEGGVPVPLLNISPGTNTSIMLDKILSDLDTPSRSFLLNQEGMDVEQADRIPFRVFPNLSSHLISHEVPPCAISLYNCHVISPSGIGDTFEAIGSEQVLLGLVAMTTDSEGLYAAIKLLTLVVNSNPRLQQDMERRGYEILALLLHRKANITTTHVLQLVASLGSCSGLITHPTAVKVLLCSFEIWRGAAEEIQAQLCTCIYNLVINGRNLEHIESMNVTGRLLELVYDSSVSWSLVQAALEVISSVISTASPKVLLTFGHYLVYSLPTSLVNEHRLKEVTHVVKIRNMLLELLCVLVQSCDMDNDFRLRLQIESTLGFDWLLLFLRPGLHHITFTMSLRLVCILLSPANGFLRFSQKLHHGGWMLGNTTKSLRPETTEQSSLQGFPLLLHVLKGHTRLSEFSTYSMKLYTWLLSLMLNMDQPPSSLSNEYNLDKTFSNKSGMLNKDPLVVILSILRDDIDDGGFEAVVRYLTNLYLHEPLCEPVYIALVDLIIALLWAPYLEPTKDLIMKRQCVLDLIQEILLNEMFKQNFDILDIILEPCAVDFGESLMVYQSIMILQTLQRIQTGAPDGISTKNFNKAAIFFSKYTLQKLWQGKLGTPISLLNSFSKLREWISKDAESQVSYCLHRAVLYFLSQTSSSSIADLQKSRLKVVHFVSENHRLIFSPGMLDTEFVICLSHLLRSTHTDGEWGKMLEEAADSLISNIKEARPDLTIYIDPTSHIPLNSVHKASKSAITSLFTGNEDSSFVVQHEIAPKLFSQIKQQQEEGDKTLHQQRSSRRFTGLLTARRQEAQLTLSVVTALNISYEINYAQNTQVMLQVSDSLRESVHSTQLQFHRVNRVWGDMQLELTQERGLWGPAEPSHLDRWELDPIEGPHRTRKRLKLNSQFYNVFQPKSPEEYRATKLKQPSSSYSKEYHHYYGVRDRVSSLTTIGGASKMSQLISARSLDADNRLMQDFLVSGESKVVVFPCIRVEGLSTIASILYLGRKSAYIIDGYTTTKEGDIMDVQMLMPEEWSERFKDILVDSASVVMKNKAAYSLCYKRITEIMKRRYSLQENGMEVFCYGGESYFLVFGSNHRNKAYHKLRYMTPSLTQKSDFASDVLSSARRHTRGDASSVFTSFRQSNVTHRWSVGEISNFQYLMYINTLAGRSYKDFMQYPIFPWVLADYDSPELDLTNPASFRDLSKPMGAQTPDRLAQFEKRYCDWIDPHGTDTNPCHYGTFYSSAMITSSYLIRLEPFTSSFIALQGGHFDLTDRLFHSIEDAWNSASRVNMCDVRELIPEFFYLPDFLVNKDKFDFGRKQNGNRIDNVKLPRWAKGDPAEFIRLHREALESDYVSRNLHLWIDLIFGYKQRGEAARLAHNTFHCYFYEGNIDLSLLTDPLRKSAVKGFINNFGQAPKQIFSRPHPARQVAYSDLVGRTFHYNVVNLRPPPREERIISSAVQQIESAENGGTLFAGKNKVLVPSSAGYNYYFTWGLPDNSMLLGAVDGKIVHVYEELEKQRVACAICPDSETLLVGGGHSYISVYTHTLARNKDTTLSLQRKLLGHTDVVSCMSSSHNHRVFVSGSRDRSVIMWDLNKLSFVRQLPEHPYPITTVHMNEVSGDVVSAAKNHLYLWTINGELVAQTSLATSTVIQVCTQTTINEWDSNNVLVSGSSDGIVRIWGVLFRKGCHGDNEKWVRTLMVRARLTMYTSFERPDNRQPSEITCVRFSEDHVSLYVGDARGRVFCWTPNDSMGKQADHWVLDSGTKECASCEVRFTFVERRHHCRDCGKVFCNTCSDFYRTIPQRNITQKVRVCKTCFDSLPEN